MVYVISKENTPLMPTSRYGKVRRLLRDEKAKVIKKTPFTIQLLYDSETYVQELTLGVDAGSKIIGVSVISESKEVYGGEVELRNNIVKLFSEKRQYRREKRSRLRYRQPRFNNRKKDMGWLAPSIQHKIQTHLKVVDDITKMLPIAKIIVEAASFDIQKIKNPDIKGEQYQQGEQMGFWNIREYVLFRDNHTCQHCKGKSKDKILNVHHKESRKTGSDRPGNLITLCETCHKSYHQGKIELKIKSNNLGFRDAAFMGIMRWAFYNELKERYENVSYTYGYITKNTRIEAGLDKGHAVDARCIAEHPNAESSDFIFHLKKIIRHNRKIHKSNTLKGGKKKRNQAEYLVKGFRLFDKVIFEGKACFVAGRRSTGYFVLKDIHGNSIHKSASWKKLKFAEISAGYMIQKEGRRTGKVIPHNTFDVA
jgi:hypothetical protein